MTAEGAEDEDLEFTLLNKRDVLVYQIPPASSSSGHKADDWKKCIWRGRCRVAGKGKDLSIKMLDADTGNLFAQCLIPGGEHDKYVERVVDSSRYFVLKITNGARHAFIGMGFEDRNDAFDFNCCLSDFKTTFVERDLVDENAESKIQGPSKDLSLKEGQKITVNLGGVLAGKKKREPQATSGGGFGLLAPPPPSGGQSRRQAASGYAQSTNPPAPMPAPVSTAPVTSTVVSDDMFGDFAGGEFADFQSAKAPAPAVVPSTTPSTPLVADNSGLAGFDFDAFSTPTTSQAPPVAPAPTPAQFDPFQAAFGNPGAQTAPAPVAGLDVFSSPAPVSAPPRSGKSDPFDEFDIFK
jgi:hypothetical protein